MNIESVKGLVALMESSSLTHLEYRDGEGELILKREGAPVIAPAMVPIGIQSPAATQAAPVADPNVVTVTAPIVGTVYASRDPEASAFISVGQSVKKGEVLCLIEAMKMFSEIPSPVDGTVEDILFTSGSLAEYDQPLVVIRKNT